jgi:tetratricopeptide (TPR) repeat protein
VQAVCRIGACLADALQYAHERGLVHLDLKPSNVLLAADGTPMVLDFHLAREPLRADGAPPPWLGGTAGYMSPEQQAALRAVQHGRPAPRPVDGRSDVYSLGVVLYEALGGSPPAPRGGPGSTTTLRHGKGPAEESPPPPRGKPTPLRRLNPRVSVGLADVVGQCLADDPGARYPDMAALAADLRRHLADLPLAGVRNRSLAERWRKWRRRRPHGVALVGMALAVLTAASAVATAAAAALTERTEAARAALVDGQARLDDGEWEAAVGALGRGLSAVRGLPFQGDLTDELDRRLRQAEQARDAADRAAAAHELHRLADRARFLYGAEDLPPAGLRGLAARCQELWEQRGRVVERLKPDGGSALEPAVRDDLLELAIFCADLQERSALHSGEDAARRAALAVLDQAEESFGPSPVLDEESALHGAPVRPTGSPPRTAWEHYALGRAFLKSGEVERAAEELRRAVRLQPQGLWPNFYAGLCAYRTGRYTDAAAAYGVCIGAAPEAAGCYYNRALAFAALGRTEEALDDYDQALRLDPSLAASALNRGILHYRAKRYAAALADLQRAGKLGADPAVVAFDRALVHLARGEQAAALDDLHRAVSQNPGQSDARKLLDSLPDR